MEPKHLIAALDPKLHDRENFDCGKPALNRYLREQASQDMKRRAAGCWVLVDAAKPQTILGYYALSPEGVEAAALPELEPALRKRFPRYDRLGAVLLGRLAVDRRCQGRHLGERLLMDAFHRALQSEIPYILMLTDPKDSRAEAFYRKYGFAPLTASRMFIPMACVAALLAAGD
jgi:ribosomal protein S18 acetylase RimI-like enzyme